GKWLLKATEQRAATILRVSAEIIKKQNDFLEKGLSYIKPMILKDIAKELDLHESTISRITNSKEISTPRGVFQLKFFFSKAISSIDGGEDISSQVVKNKIKKLIDNEGQIVLSDTKLVSLLKESGINVARRTVAKYRANMKILPSFERKKSKFLYS
ncbi:RNA polymerase sigma-54 factor, partial [Hyphomicrobiales bacterium]|nr:RNA polymerase sigma-54 factor [Hyphomicrobiales bacterium]